MADLRLLANMNISPETVNALSEKGIDIIRVSQILPVTSSDREILDLARREDRVVVTQDLDFSALLALGGFNQRSLITLCTTFNKGDLAKEIGPGKSDSHYCGRR